jgi:NAD(P)H-hydrate epimerase
MKALTAAEMREVDRHHPERHGRRRQLMENAGKAVAEFVPTKVHFDESPARNVIVLCGKGRNGGDGFVAARYLHREIRRIVVILIGSTELRGDPRRISSGEKRAAKFPVENEAAWAEVFRKFQADVIPTPCSAPACVAGRRD